MKNWWPKRKYLRPKPKKRRRDTRNLRLRLRLGFNAKPREIRPEFLNPSKSMYKYAVPFYSFRYEQPNSLVSVACYFDKFLIGIAASFNL